MPVPPSATVSDLAGTLFGGELRPVRDWLRRTLIEDTGRLAGADVDDLARLAQWNSEEHESDQRAGGPSIADRQAKSAATVGRALVAAADVPLAGPLLVLYLRAECELAWEVSWDHGPIRHVVASAVDGWHRIVASGAAVADHELTTVALAYLRMLDSELTVETAASCASLTQWERHARRTAVVAAEVVAAAARVRADLVAGDPRAELAGFIAAEARAGERCYHAVALAAGAVHRHFAGGDAELETAIGVLREVEQDEGLDAIDRSELRAHRYNLQALREAAQRPWLRVEYGKIVYLYPFGLRGTAPVDAVRALRSTGARWTLAGMPVVRVSQDLLLNDIWQGDDPLERQYRGAAVHLPDLEVPDPDRAEPSTLQVELRLSELGNHYLRIEAPLTGADPHHLYAALLRAAPEFGDLTELGLAIRVSGEDGDAALEWGQLADLADELIKDVAAQLRTHTDRQVTASARPGTYHVMVTVERAVSTRGGADAVPLANAGELTGTFGAQPLCHPVRHGISSVAEWLRYPIDDLPVVDAPGFRDDLVLRTANTTLMVIPGSPHYMIFAVEEAAEFVATLDGLFAAWQDELANFYGHVRPALTAMIAQIEGRSTGLAPTASRDGGAEHDHTADGLVYSQTWLEQQLLRLHEFVMGSRLTLMFITSPSLVASPVMRLTLDRLLAAAGFNRLRDQFVGMVDEVLGGRLAALIDASVRRHHEQREAAARIEREREEAATRAAAQREEKLAQVQRRRMDTLLAVIAAVGVSGLAQILQAGYDLKQLQAVTLAGLVVVGAVVFGLVVHRINGRRTPPIDAVPSRLADREGLG